MKQCLPPVIEDVKAQIEDETTKAVLDQIATKTLVYIYPHSIIEGVDSAKDLPYADGDKVTRYQYMSTQWRNGITSCVTNETTISILQTLKKISQAVADGILTADVETMETDRLLEYYALAAECTKLTGSSGLPKSWRLDVSDEIIAQVSEKALACGTKAVSYYTAAVTELTSVASNPNMITFDNYAAARIAFQKVAEFNKALSSLKDNEDKDAADAVYKEFYNTTETKQVLIKLVQDRIAYMLETYQTVNESNVEEARADLAMIDEIVADTAFTSRALNADTTRIDGVYIRDIIAAEVAKLDTIRGAVELASGAADAFLDAVAALNAKYEANGNKFLVEEVETVMESLNQAKAAYDTLSAGLKATQTVVDNLALYNTLRTANNNAFYERNVIPYEEAVNETTSWLEQTITMKEFATVRAILENLDELYAAAIATPYDEYTEEQKAAITALNEKHMALQAKYDAALNSEDAYIESEFEYPEGLNEEIAAEAIATLDGVLNNPELVNMLGGALGQLLGGLLGEDFQLTIPADATSLGDLVQKIVNENLYTDATVTALTKLLYPTVVSLLDEAASGASGSVSLLNIYILPEDVAKQISDEYPLAKAAIAAGGSAWTDGEGNSTVNWDNVKWGVETGNKEAFYTALGQAFNGLNALLNTLLNNTNDAQMIGQGITGIPGYETTILPLLEVLGCEDLKTAEEYKADKSTKALLQNILEPIINRVIEICNAPVQELTSLLPQLAYFLNAGGLKQILDPFVIEVDVSIMDIYMNINLYDTLNGLINLDDLNAGLKGLITGAIPNFNWVDIDFVYLAGLGNWNADTQQVTADNSKVTVALLEYVGKVLNANAQFIKDSIPAIADENLAGVVNGLLDTVLNAEPGKIATALVHFIAPQCETAVSPYNYPEIEQNGLVIPEGVIYGEDAYAQTPAALDNLLKGFGLDLAGMVSGALYTDDLINQVFGLYDTIRANATVAQVFGALGIDISEETIAALKAEAGSVTDQASFVKALTTALSPFDDVLAMLFAGEDYSVFGYTVKGMDNYNTVVIPLLEVLGCTDVMSYADYQAAVAGGASPLEAIVTQVLDRLNEILASPVDNLTKVLPNVAYFLDSNNLSVMVKNLLAPLDTLLAHVDVDLMATVNSLLTAFGIPSIDDLDNDLAGLLNQVLGMIEVGGAPLALVLPNIDLHKLASYGTAETYTSAMVIDGQNVEAKRIVADQAAVTGAVIGYLYEVLADEATMDLITSLLGDSGAMVEGILGGLLGNGEAGFTNALFELLGFTPKADDNNGGEGGNGNEGGNENVDTGDAMLAVVAGAGVLAAGAILVLSRKKKEK